MRCSTFSTSLSQMMKKVIAVVHMIICLSMLLAGIRVIKLFLSDIDGVYAVIVPSGIFEIRKAGWIYYAVSFCATAVLCGIGALLLVMNPWAYVKMLRWTAPIATIFVCSNSLLRWNLPTFALGVLFFMVVFMYIISIILEHFILKSKRKGSGENNDYK